MAGPFELALSQFAKKCGDQAEAGCRNVVLEFASRVVSRSPVDTGRFRSNWYVSADGPDETATEDTDKHSANGLDSLSGKVAGKTFWIQNNLPYAWSLETGSSKQAPLGMVGLTALEFNSIVDQSFTLTLNDSLGILGVE